MIKIAPLAIAIAILTPTLALAHAPEDRMAEQQAKIEQGRKTGDITWREGLRLRQEQREIARVENELAADGRLTKSERRVLRKLQNNAEANIVTEATDTRHRPWFLPRFGR